MSTIEQIRQARENTFQELKDNLEIAKADDFKYITTIDEFKEIIDRFERLRDEELILLGSIK